MKPLPVDSSSKLSHHIDMLFGNRVSTSLEDNVTFEHSKSTGRLKYFFIRGQLGGTFRTDGGIALTIHGARTLLTSKSFNGNCVIANKESVPFVSEGRSLFCKHVESCGSNVKVGSEVALLDQERNVIAVGVAIHNANTMMEYRKGVAVKTRQGMFSREDRLSNKE